MTAGNSTSIDEAEYIKLLQISPGPNHIKQLE